MTVYVCQPMAAYVCQPSTWERDEELRPSWATGDPFSLRILSRGVFLLESVLSIAAPLKRQKPGAFEVLFGDAFLREGVLLCKSVWPETPGSSHASPGTL